MARVKRANVVLKIQEEDVKYYVSHGYNLIDNDGKVIQAAVPTDLTTLQNFYIEGGKKLEELEKMVEQLEDEKRNLKDENDKLQKQLKSKAKNRKEE